MTDPKQDNFSKWNITGERPKGWSKLDILLLTEASEEAK